MSGVYDNENFFQAYAQMPRSKEGLKAAGEWNQMQMLLGDVQGKCVLDLGCGYGWHCRYAARQGAACVVGIDVSEKMIARARQDERYGRIHYAVCALEAYAYPRETFDLVISNLALHYVADLEPVYRGIYQTLKTGGHFVMNIEHPTFTAGVQQEWIRDEKGNALYWPVDCYFEPGQRQTQFLGCSVVKQHHTLTQILNPLLQIGFVLRAVEEAVPPQSMRDLPQMQEELRRPMMLLVCAQKV